MADRSGQVQNGRADGMRQQRARFVIVAAAGPALRGDGRPGKKRGTAQLLAAVAEIRPAGSAAGAGPEKGAGAEPREGLAGDDVARGFRYAGGVRRARTNPGLVIHAMLLPSGGEDRALSRIE